jgi:hypothetical protein
MTSVTLTAGPDDPGPTHYDRDADGCQCKTCKRRRAMLGEGLVPRIDGVTGRAWSNPDPHGTPDIPPQHPVTGRFMSPPHPEDASRDLRGRFR